MKKGRPACPVFPVRGNRIHPSRRNRKVANFAVGSEFTQHTHQRQNPLAGLMKTGKHWQNLYGLQDFSRAP